MQSIQNLGLAVIALVANETVNKGGYLVLEVLFVANIGLTLIVGKAKLCRVELG